MTHKLDADDFFIHRVQRACAERGLNFFLIEPTWVENFYDLTTRGAIWTRVLLNLHSEHHRPDDIYHRLIRLAAERQTKVIDPPEIALAAFDKARLHQHLITAGLGVPPTVIVRRDQFPDFKLTESERNMLGTPFVIKPSLGYGRRGVVLDATSEADLARSLAAWPDPNYLFQKLILPRSLGADPAYFRVFYVFGSTWCCWWNCFTDRYRSISSDEAATLDLTALQAIVHRVAGLTGMNFFSSEIAQTESGNYVLIDYVNDQCHLLTQTANPQIGVPDEIVAAIAERLVTAAHGLITNVAENRPARP